MRNAYLPAQVSQLLMLALVTCADAEPRPALRLLGLQPITGVGWSGGAAVPLAAKMAVADINNRTDVLPDHELVYEYIDTQVRAV